MYLYVGNVIWPDYDRTFSYKLHVYYNKNKNDKDKRNTLFQIKKLIYFCFEVIFFVFFIWTEYQNIEITNNNVNKKFVKFSS